MIRPIAASLMLLGGLYLAAPEPAHAAPVALGTLGGVAAQHDGQVHKVHRWRGRWHCESRHHGRSGWHWHRRACRDHGHRHHSRKHRWHRRHDHPGCSWHPRHGLRCNF